MSIQTRHNPSASLLEKRAELRCLDYRLYHATISKSGERQCQYKHCETLRVHCTENEQDFAAMTNQFYTTTRQTRRETVSIQTPLSPSVSPLRKRAELRCYNYN